MDKSTLVAKVTCHDALAGRDLSSVHVRAVIDAMFETLTRLLRDGKEVGIVQFGRFTIVKRGDFTIINPRNGEPLYVPPYKTVNFRPSMRLKRLVAESDGNIGAAGSEGDRVVDGGVVDAAPSAPSSAPVSAVLWRGGDMGKE